ncbi:hypothetical protein SOPP22_13825 [Shewanella sp. OPT22]|nr:hypothetical protein SOPP22_13825 [Shewanella sp. OPT22]
MLAMKEKSVAIPQKQLQTKLPLLGYGLMLAGLVFPIVLLGGISWLIYYRNSNDLYLKNHLKYIKRTTIIGAYLFAVALLLNSLFIGYFLIFPVWLWCIYRFLRGFLLCLFNGLPYGKKNYG